MNSPLESKTLLHASQSRCTAKARRRAEQNSKILTEHFYLELSCFNFIKTNLLLSGKGLGNQLGYIWGTILFLMVPIYHHLQIQLLDRDRARIERKMMTIWSIIHPVINMQFVMNFIYVAISYPRVNSFCRTA